MKLGVFGVGMYSTGRGTTGIGTIIPAVFQAIESGQIEEVVLFGTSSESEKEAVDRLRSLIDRPDDIGRLRISHEIGDYKILDDAIKHWGIDAAIVAAPDQVHYSILKSLAMNDVHALCVKPLTDRIDSAVLISNLFEERGIIGLVEFHKRFDTANQIIRRDIKHGRIGRLCRVNVDYAQPKYMPLDIFKKWVHSANVFQYLGVHYVDQIYYVTGAIPVEVTVYPVARDVYEKINVYDQINVVVKWREHFNNDEFHSFHMTSWTEVESTLHVSKQNIEYVGDGGRIYSDQSDRGLRVLDNKGYEIPNPYFTVDTDGSLDPSLITGYGIDCVRYFLNSAESMLKKNTSLEEVYSFDKACSFKESLVSMAVVDAVNKCIASNLGRVEINDYIN